MFWWRSVAFRRLRWFKLQPFALMSGSKNTPISKYPSWAASWFRRQWRQYFLLLWKCSICGTVTGSRHARRPARWSRCCCCCCCWCWCCWWCLVCCNCTSLQRRCASIRTVNSPLKPLHDHAQRKTSGPPLQHTDGRCTSAHLLALLPPCSSVHTILPLAVSMKWGQITASDVRVGVGERTRDCGIEGTKKGEHAGSLHASTTTTKRLSAKRETHKSVSTTQSVGPACAHVLRWAPRRLHLTRRAGQHPHGLRELGGARHEGTEGATWGCRLKRLSSGIDRFGEPDGHARRQPTSSQRAAQKERNLCMKRKGETQHILGKEIVLYVVGSINEYN